MAQVNTTTSILTDGIGDQMTITVPDAVSTEFNAIGDKGYLSVWINTTDTGGGRIAGIFDGAAGRLNFRLAMQSDGKIVGTVLRDAGSTATPPSVASYNDGNWHHLVLFVDGQVVYLFIDRIVEVGTGSTSGNALIDTLTFFIGGVVGSFLNMNITQVMMGSAYTNSRADVVAELNNSDSTADATGLSVGAGTLVVNYECPAVTPPINTADLGLANGGLQGNLTVTGLTISDAVLDYPAPTNFDFVEFDAQIQQTASFDAQIQQTASFDGQIQQTKEFTVER